MARRNQYENVAANFVERFNLDWHPATTTYREGGIAVFGTAYLGTRSFEAPVPNTPRRLMTWLHEAAHVVGPFFGAGPLDVHRCEVKAWAWASREYRKALGVRPPDSWRKWVRRQLEGQFWLAMEQAYAVIEAEIKTTM